MVINLLETIANPVKSALSASAESLLPDILKLTLALFRMSSVILEHWANVLVISVTFEVSNRGMDWREVQP